MEAEGPDTLTLAVRKSVRNIFASGGEVDPSKNVLLRNLLGNAYVDNIVENAKNQDEQTQKKLAAIKEKNDRLREVNRSRQQQKDREKRPQTTEPPAPPPPPGGKFVIESTTLEPAPLPVVNSVAMKLLELRKGQREKAMAGRGHKKVTRHYRFSSKYPVVTSAMLRRRSMLLKKLMAVRALSNQEDEVKAKAKDGPRERIVKVQPKQPNQYQTKASLLDQFPINSKESSADTETEAVRKALMKEANMEIDCVKVTWVDEIFLPLTDVNARKLLLDQQEIMADRNSRAQLSHPPQKPSTPRATSAQSAVRGQRWCRPPRQRPARRIKLDAETLGLTPRLTEAGKRSLAPTKPRPKPKARRKPKPSSKAKTGATVRATASATINYIQVVPQS